MAGRRREGEAESSWTVESWKNKTRVVWCAPMWALREQDGVMIEGGEKKSGKQIVEERRERRVRLLHTVQHARQNTTSLCTTTATNTKYSKGICRGRELNMCTALPRYHKLSHGWKARFIYTENDQRNQLFVLRVVMLPHCSPDKHDTCCVDASLYWWTGLTTGM